MNLKLQAWIKAEKRFIEWNPEEGNLEGFLLAIAQMEMESGIKIPLYVDYEETEPVIEM